MWAPLFIFYPSWLLSRLFLKIKAVSSSLRIDISLPHSKWTPTPYEGVLPKSFSSKVKQHTNKVVLKHWGVRRRGGMWGTTVDVFRVCASRAVLGFQYSHLFGYSLCWSLLSPAPQKDRVHLFLLKHTLILDYTFGIQHGMLPPFIQKNAGILQEIFLIWLDQHRVLVVFGLVVFLFFLFIFLFFKTMRKNQFCRQWVISVSPQWL